MFDNKNTVVPEKRTFYMSLVDDVVERIQNVLSRFPRRIMTMMN